MGLVARTGLAVRRALGNPRLVVLLWGAHLLIAGVAAFPVLRHLDRGLALAPAGDVFLHRLSLPLLADLGRLNGESGSVLGPLLVVVAILTLLWNLLASGGALESLLSNDPARLAQRFGRGAGRFFWRFLRMGLAAVATALAAAALVAGPVFGIGAALDDTAEGAKYWLALAGAGVALFVLLIVLLALDLARVRVARDDAQRGVRIFFQTLRATVRRPGRVLALWALLTLLFAAFTALYCGIRQLLPPTGGAPLFALFLAQQLLMLTRAGIRIALWSGEIALVDQRWPEAPLSERLR